MTLSRNMQNNCQRVVLFMDPIPGIGKFSKTPVATSKFLAPVRWHDADTDWGRTVLEWHASLTFMWRLPLCTWEFRHISLCKGNNL